MVSKKVELLTHKEQNRILQYMNFDSKNINKLYKAFKDQDLDEQYNAISNMSVSERFVSDLYKVYDAEFKESFVKTILDTNTHLIDDVDIKHKKNLMFKPKVKPFEPKKRMVIKKIQSNGYRLDN